MNYSYHRINSAAMPHTQPTRGSPDSPKHQQQSGQRRCDNTFSGTYYEYIQSHQKARPPEPCHTSYRISSSDRNNSNVDTRRHDATYTQSRSRAYSSSHQEERSPMPPAGHIRGASHTGHVDRTARPGLAQPEILPRTMSVLRRPDSGSSMSSYASATTPPTDRSSWSTAPTPEPMSPTSPYSHLQIQTPLRNLSKSGSILHSGEVSPESTSVRPARPVRTICRSLSRRFHNTPIEVPVSEEEENPKESSKEDSKEDSKENSEKQSLHLPGWHEGGTGTNHTPAPNAHQTTEEKALEAHNRHRHRHGRQQKTVTYTAFPQPPRTLPALPPLPLATQGVRASSAPTAPRRLNREASRSLPQLRACIGPPPSEPLPPLPSVPQISPMFPPSRPATPITTTTPTTSAVVGGPPSTLTPEIYSPPASTLPPPPPPPPAVDAANAASADKEKSTTTSPPTALSSGSEDSGSAPHSAAGEKKQHQAPRKPVQTAEEEWDQELQRHKQLLKNLPAQSEPPRERLKLSRSYKSLGNLRARARGHTTAAARDDIVTASGIVHTSSSKAHKPKIHWTSVSKIQRDAAGRRDEPSHPLPKAEGGPEPIVSVFEDDSDDEGDTVRRFVRNILSCRSRSDVVATTLSSEKPPASIIKAEETNHNSRKKNYSSSSSFSLATTVGASTVASSTTTIAPTISEASSTTDSDNSQTTSLAETGSSRSSAEQPRQRGPLLTRMFVRRSH